MPEAGGVGWWWRGARGWRLSEGRVDYKGRGRGVDGLRYGNTGGWVVT